MRIVDDPTSTSTLTSHPRPMKKMKPTRSPHLAALAVGLAMTCIAPLATASPASEAKDLFARARDLRATNQCESASPLFEKAWRLYPEGLGSLRNLAECEEQLGHFASSRRAWLDLKRALVAAPHDPKYAGWENDAERAAQRLRSNVATFIVDVYVTTPTGEALADETSGVELFVDGESLGTLRVGTPIERDPGTYEIRLVTPDGLAVEQTVAIGAGDNPHTSIRLTAAHPSSPKRLVDAAALPAPDRTDHPTRRTIGYAAFGVGAGALVGSLVTFLVRNAAESDVDAVCPSHVNCPESVRPSLERGTTMSTLTSVLLPVGLAGTLGGAALVLTSTSSSKKPSTTATEVRISPALGGFGISGRF